MFNDIQLAEQFLAAMAEQGVTIKWNADYKVGEHQWILSQTVDGKSKTWIFSDQKVQRYVLDWYRAKHEPVANLSLLKQVVKSMKVLLEGEVSGPRMGVK